MSAPKLAYCEHRCLQCRQEQRGRLEAAGFRVFVDDPLLKGFWSHAKPDDTICDVQFDAPCFEHRNLSQREQS